MNYKVSVIIPCYNAENTIERAINSVINQSLGFENIELLLYDDASTDNTQQIIKYFSKKYKNIIPIFSNYNSGRPSKGRNICMDRVSSDFIMFMDNDDEYHEEICENLYNTIILTDSDLVACSYINLDHMGNQKKILQYKSEKSVIENNNIIFYTPNIFYFDNIYIWNCIFKKEIIIKNKVYFPENSFAEDVYFSRIYKLFVNKLVYLDNYFGLFRHVQNNSLSNSFNIAGLINIHEINMEMYFKLEQFCAPVEYIFKSYMVDMLILFYKSNSASDNSKVCIFDFFNKIGTFTKKTNIGDSSGIILGIPIFFIIHKRYNLALIYLKLLKKIRNSKLLLKIYRYF